VQDTTLVFTPIVEAVTYIAGINPSVYTTKTDTFYGVTTRHHPLQNPDRKGINLSV